MNAARDEDLEKTYFIFDIGRKICMKILQENAPKVRMFRIYKLAQNSQTHDICNLCSLLVA